jgi:protein-S-isoprenylcysteine O-methyltransferase Ste14
MNEITAGKESASSLRLRGFMFGLLPLFMMGAILFLSAGTLAWLAAWAILGAIFVAVVIVSFTCHTDLVMERTIDQAGAKEYDKKIVRLMNLVGLSVMLVAGLDFRFGWTKQFPVSVQMGAFILFLAGYCLFCRAMIANRFFSLIARIQSDKGHHPVSTGPYRYIRHPGYLGFILVVLMQPLILGSFWAVIPAVLTAGLIIKRTGLEDGMLILELVGYQEYARVVKYRLVPGVW